MLTIQFVFLLARFLPVHSLYLYKKLKIEIAKEVHFHDTHYWRNRLYWQASRSSTR